MIYLGTNDFIFNVQTCEITYEMVKMAHGDDLTNYHYVIEQGQDHSVSKRELQVVKEFMVGVMSPFKIKEQFKYARL